MSTKRRLLLWSLEPLTWIGLVGLMLFVLSNGLRQMIVEDTK